MQNPPDRQNGLNFCANVAIWCPERCWISFKLLVVYILGLESPSLTLWVGLRGIIPHLPDSNPESFQTSLNIKTPILKVSIPVSISRLKSWKSWYQSWYQDCNLTSLDTSLNIKTAIIKVSISVSISRPDFQKSQYQYPYQD